MQVLSLSLPSVVRRPTVEMLQLLHRLAKETNKVVFLSTHDLELALRIADRLVELNKNGLQVVPAQQVKEEINRLLE